MQQYELEDIISLKEEDFELYNQLMIKKALDDGFWNFIPIKKISHKSIGECIEIRYNQLYNENFEIARRDKKIDDYIHTLPNRTPKITKRNSLLYTREWILAAKKIGIPIPNRKVCNRDSYSLGEIIELSYYGKQINECINNKNVEQKFPTSSTNRKKIKLKIKKITRKKMVFYEE